MKLINGVWLPDGDRDGWLTRAPLDRTGWPMYQRDRLAAIVTALEPLATTRRRFIDGGAHVGLMTVPASRLFAHVDAFEPNPDTFACLARNIESFPVTFGQITPRQVALGSSTRDVTLVARKQASSLSWYASEDQAHAGDMTVSMMTIDDPAWDDVDAIKLDLEGGEYDALLGARETIMLCRPVVLIEEKHDPAFRASSFLTSLGMACTWSKKHDLLFTWPHRKRRAA